MDYDKFYMGRVMTSVSRLGNSLSGGHPNISVSSRIGYMHSLTGSRYWRFCVWVVDGTFYPLEGGDHCKKSFEREGANHHYSDVILGYGWSLVILTWLMLCICAPLALVLWIHLAMKKILSYA